ncbi:uncharacterized protein FTOL_01405 [Fusarium torulosum]|uniref:Uncharacterized protein n=1 Tax=Fusarium torulosum TaxID=33205 RepID=A0AAE8M010_9HYPO|nr:uncharacterized protein FTOL_01405 [Fusarium torulosum]
MPILFPTFDRTNNEAQRRSSFTMQEQKDTPLEETIEATDSQHGARDLKDRDGNEDAASPQMRDSEPSPNNEISTSNETPTGTDEIDHTTSTVVLIVTESMTFVFVDHSAYYTLTATLDTGSEVPTSSSEVLTSSSDILSFNDRFPLFGTITVGDITSPPKAWFTSYTSQSLPALSTTTVTEVSSAQPQFSFSTVEWVGVIVGIICIISMMFVFLLFLFQRRRRVPRPAESQNNINIRLDNVPPPVSRWSRSDSTRTNMTPSNYTDSRELKTTFVPRPLGAASPPPKYEGDQKYWTGEYEEQDLGIQGNVGEPSGSRYAEAYSSAVYNDPKWKGKQREEF